jgi:hypothetical protein
MLIVHSGRNPFAVFLLCACVLIGVAGLISPQKTSPTVAHLLLPWELAAWYGGLIASGAGTLAGLAVKGLTGLLVERAGLVFLASLSGMYAVAVAVQGGGALSFAAALTGCFCAASLARVWQIGRDLKQLPTAQGER